MHLSIFSPAMFVNIELFLRLFKHPILICDYLESLLFGTILIQFIVQVPDSGRNTIALQNRPRDIKHSILSILSFDWF